MKNCAIGGLVVSVLWEIIFIVCRHNWMRKILDMNRRVQYCDKYLSFLMQWKKAEQNGIRLTEEIKKKGYNKVAVYGMGELGWIVCNDLLNAGLEVAYAIDRDADQLSYNAFSNIPDVWLKLPEEDLESVDLIIVTAINSYPEIKANLQQKYSYRVMSIEELVK